MNMNDTSNVQNNHNSCTILAYQYHKTTNQYQQDCQRLTNWRTYLFV